MVIDIKKCIGCNACTIACKAENVTPPGVSYNVVLENEIGTFPDVTRKFVPRPCMHCEKPFCVKVCPVRATYKRPDGIVVINYKRCIGCRYCIAACPYGARYFDFGEYYTEETPNIMDYEKREFYEYEGSDIGEKWRREGKRSPIGNTRKCTFCLHRLSKKMLPSCVVTCLGKARYFGDLNDTESFVSMLIATGETMRLKEDIGNEPSVYYRL